MSPALLLTLAQLRELAVTHGFQDPDVAAAVAMAESEGNPRARGDLTVGISLGLWQVNLRWHPEWRDEADLDGSKGTHKLYDPDTNASAALAISHGGTYWKPWSTYTSGAYKRFLPLPSERPTLPDLAPNATALLRPDDDDPSDAA